jgi:hypothetical protein
MVYVQERHWPGDLWRLPGPRAPSPGGPRGEETEVFAGPLLPWAWALGPSGAYFLVLEPTMAQSNRTLGLFDLQSGHVTELLRRDAFIHTLAVSPDEEWILYGESPPDTSELMLVENFRGGRGGLSPGAPS